MTQRPKNSPTNRCDARRSYRKTFHATLAAASRGALDPYALYREECTDYWPIQSPFDAVDALDLCRPPDFESGVLVLLLDVALEPIVSLAIRNAPGDCLDPIMEMIIESTEEVAVMSVVAGIVRPPSHMRLQTGSSIDDQDINADRQHWIDMAYLLGTNGIDLLDVLTLHERCWSSTALLSGHLSYPDPRDPYDDRKSWYELASPDF
jgi:hypothetical protein